MYGGREEQALYSMQRLPCSQSGTQCRLFRSSPGSTWLRNEDPFVMMVVPQKYHHDIQNDNATLFKKLKCLVQIIFYPLQNFMFS